MKCNHCGAENRNNAVYCRSCGRPLQNGESNSGANSGSAYGYGQNMQGWGTSQAPVQTTGSSDDVSVWGWVGYQILFAIPLVGLILAIVFACGAGNNETLKKYAISRLIILGISLAIVILLSIIMGTTLSMIFSSMY